MIRSNIIIKTIIGIEKVLPQKFKKRSLIVVFLLFINSVLELFGLASLIPLFSIVFKENAIHENSLLSWIYNSIGFTTDNQFIIAFSGIVISIIILKNILSLLINRYQANFSFDIMEYLMLRLNRMFHSKGFLFFKQNNSNVIYNDIYLVPQKFASITLFGTLTLLNEIIILSLILIAITWYNSDIVFVLLAIIVPVFLLFYSLTKNKIKNIGYEINKVSPKISSNIFQSVFGYVDVIITGTQNYFFSNLNENITTFKKLNVDRTVLSLAPTKIIESVMVFAIFIVVIYGIFFLPSRESILALLGVYALSAYRIMPSINRIMIAINGLIETQYTFNVIAQLESFNESCVLQDKNSITFDKEIIMENVCFKYSPTKENVLNNFNLIIKKGETLGIMGKSGGGKTTLMNLLLGFLQPTSGSIKIDGQPLDEDTIVGWQNKIGYVQQEVFLLDASLAENIAFGLHADEINYKKLNDVITLASLDDFVTSLPNGVDTTLGERGTQLSGGQRQRIGIARALYFDSEVLFFDEATSALDAQTENEITESINKLSREGLTMIIIAHRKSSLKSATKIVTIKNGKIL